jgi:hypothetical protein
MSPKELNKASETDKQKKKDQQVKPAQSGASNPADLLIAPSPALESKMYRIRRWGDPEMLQYGFDVNQVNTTNFQAVGLFNKETGFGAVTNYLYMLRDDIDNLQKMQFDQAVEGKNASKKGKMDWLCEHRGKIYMYDKETDDWQTAPKIRWGTVAIGGNLVQVDGFEEMELQLRGGGHPVAMHKMARLVGFRKTDWARPLNELLAEGLVHRCYCAYKDNRFGDSPKGTVYSPLFSPLDWDFNGAKQPSAFYLPMEYLEPKGS